MEKIKQKRQKNFLRPSIPSGPARPSFENSIRKLPSAPDVFEKSSETLFEAPFPHPLGKFKRSVSLICWAYNEEELIEGFLHEAYALMKRTVEDFEIVLIDDASTDKTPEIIQKLQAEMPELRVLRNKKNRNVGFSCRRAIMEAQKEFLFWQTIDWSYNISRLRDFLELLETYDIVAGVRRAPIPLRGRFSRTIVCMTKLLSLPHLTKRSDTIPKALVSVVNYMLVRLLYGVPLSDFQNVVIYPTQHIQSIQPEAHSAFVNPELLIKSYWAGKSIAEVPISFIPRQAGQAKGTHLKAIGAAVRDVLKFWFQWRVLRQRPFVKKGTVERRSALFLEQAA